MEGSDSLTRWAGMPIGEVTPALSAGLPPPDAGWSYRTFRTPGGTGDDTSDYLRVRVTAP